MKRIISISEIAAGFLLRGLGPGLLIAVPVMYWGCADADSRTVQVSGSTTLQSFVSQAAGIYQQSRELPIEVRPTGSKKGIQELTERRCHIAMSSAKISRQELALAVSKGIKIKPFLLGYDSIVPVVHPRNPVGEMTRAQLNGIFSGTLNNWKAFGLPDNRIEVVARDSWSGTGGVWAGLISGSPSGGEHMVIKPSNSGVLSFVASHPLAIGYISSVYINPEVRPVSVNTGDTANKLQPDSPNPFKRELYLYVNEDDFSGSVKSFVTFLLVNQKAKALFQQLGFSPFS